MGDVTNNRYIYDEDRDEVIDGPYRVRGTAEMIVLTLRIAHPSWVLGIRTHEELLAMGHHPNVSVMKRGKG